MKRPVDEKSSSHINYGFEVEAKDFRLPLFRQVHGSELVTIESPSHRDALLLSPPQADAALTAQSELELYVFTADCLPVLLYTDDPSGPIAAVHCGWRGAKQNIVGLTVERMGVPPAELHAVLGPAILGCCFEVRQDFINAFREAGHSIDRFLEESRGRYFFNLADFVVESQLSALAPERLNTEELRCTYCSAPPLPSYRRNGGTDPRIRSWIRKRPTRS